MHVLCTSSILDRDVWGLVCCLVVHLQESPVTARGTVLHLRGTHSFSSVPLQYFGDSLSELLDCTFSREEAK